MERRVVMIDSPFKFLDSYAIEDKDIFFGRDLEVEEVYNKVFQDKTLFIYGESGTGKTSLVNCGLANKFRETDWLPVYVRRGDNINASVIHELEKIALTEVKNLNGSFSRNMFKYTRSIYLDYFKPIYFIFDQFEELYLMGSKQEWKEFISGIKLLTEKDLHVHFIFVIRAEYLHFMSEFEEELPEIFNNKLRVEKISRVHARECIEGPCKVYGIKLEENFTDYLFDQLSPDRSEIELTYLQVFLDRVYKLAKEENTNGEQIVFSKEILDKIGMVSDVLSEFLDEQIESMRDKENTLTVLKSFVTIDGTKRQVSTEDVISFSKSLGISLEDETVESIIKELLERRILKELPDIDKFELRHDALANKIFEKITTREKELIEVRQFLDYGLAEYQKRGFLLNEQDLAYVEPHMETLDLSDEIEEFVNESIRTVGKKRRVRKRVIIVISIIVVLLIISILAMVEARQQRASALEQESRALLSAEEAQKQKSIAESNASLAFESQQLAEKNAEEASRQASIANRQRLLAEEQKTVADSNRIEAENQRSIALVQKDSAETARAQALIYLEQANEERKRAELLSMQSLARSMGIKAAQLPDLELKSLLALQAYDFNKEYQGYAYQSDIYNGLYQAVKQASGPEFNVFKKHTSAITSIENSGNNVFTTGSDGKVYVWAPQLNNSRLFAETEKINNNMSISPNGGRMAIATASSNILIYDTKNGNILNNLSGHSGEVWEAILTDDNSVISSGEDMKVLRWDLRNGSSKELHTFQTQAHTIDFNPIKNRLLIGLDDGSIIEYDFTAEDITEIGGREGDMVSKIKVNSNGSVMAVGYESGTIQLWNLRNYEILETLPGHTAHVSDLKFSGDDKFLISAGYDRKNLFWNLADIKESPVAWTDHETFVWATEFLNDGNIIAGELNGAVKMYNPNMTFYAEKICNQVNRNLTQKEWETFVREDIPYSETCNNRTP